MASPHRGPRLEPVSAGQRAELDRRYLDRAPFRGSLAETHAPTATSWLARFLGDLVEAGAATPPGLRAFGEGVVRDAIDYPRSTVAGARAIQAAKEADPDLPLQEGMEAAFRAGWPLLLPRTRGVGREMALAMRDDFRHPLRHPGYTLLSSLAVAGGATASARAATAAARAARNAQRARRAGRPSPSPARAAVRAVRAQPKPVVPAVAGGLRRGEAREQAMAARSNESPAERRERERQQLKSVRLMPFAAKAIDEAFGPTPPVALRRRSGR